MLLLVVLLLLLMLSLLTLQQLFLLQLVVLLLLLLLLSSLLLLDNFNLRRSRTAPRLSPKCLIFNLRTGPRLGLQCRSRETLRRRQARLYFGLFLCGRARLNFNLGLRGCQSRLKALHRPSLSSQFSLSVRQGRPARVELVGALHQRRT